MRILLSWSGEKSKSVAHALRDWLTGLLPTTQFWLSDEDLRAGSRWPQELGKILDQTDVGILCITKDNLNAPWLLFEAGALAKSRNRAQVIPFLLDVPASKLAGPLAVFQAVDSSKEGVMRLVRSIASSSGGPISLEESRVLCEPSWPVLKKKLLAAQWRGEIPRIGLLGSTTKDIAANREKTEALVRFYRWFLSHIDRTPFGINSCGAEPVRQAFFETYREKLYVRPKQQLVEINRRVRWYWFPGDDLGLNFAPAFFEEAQARDAIDRLLMEVADSKIIVALAGRVGTREQVQRLLSYHHGGKHGIDLRSKPLVMLGWFGGSVSDLLREQESRLGWLLDSYAALNPMACFEHDLTSPGLAESLARNLVHFLNEKLSGTDIP